MYFKLVLYVIILVLSIVAMSSTAKVRDNSDSGSENYKQASMGYNSSTGVFVISLLLVGMCVWKMMSGSKYGKYFSL